MGQKGRMYHIGASNNIIIRQLKRKKKGTEIETEREKDLGRPSGKALDFGKNKIAQTQLTLGFGLVASFSTTTSHVVLQAYIHHVKS